MYLADDLLIGNGLPCMVLAFYLLAASALIFCVLERPWLHLSHLSRQTVRLSRRVAWILRTVAVLEPNLRLYRRSCSSSPDPCLPVRSQFQRVAVNSAVVTLSTVLWLLGIRNCRAMRSTLLEYADLPLALFFVLNTKRFVLEADFHRVRGSLVTAGGVLLVTLSVCIHCSIDTATSLINRHSKRRLCPSLASAVFGVFMLFCFTVVSFSRVKKSQALAAEVGSMRLLNCLSLILAAVWALPLAVVAWWRHQPHRPGLGTQEWVTWVVLGKSLVCALTTILIKLFMEPFLLAKGAQVPQSCTGAVRASRTTPFDSRYFLVLSRWRR
jgi:hypothetical protein